MSRDITTVVENALDDSVIYPFFAIELLFDTSPLRLWTGFGDLELDGETWTGTGALLGISNVTETSEIAAKGATLTLSGIPSEVLSLALQEPYQGRICRIYFGVINKEAGEYDAGAESPSLVADFSTETYLLDSDIDPAASSVEVFSGYMDTMDIEESADTSKIELSVENKLIDLERARTRRYTSAYQKSIYPGDLGLDFVEDLQDKDIVWGRKIEGQNSNA